MVCQIWLYFSSSKNTSLDSGQPVTSAFSLRTNEWKVLNCSQENCRRGFEVGLLGFSQAGKKLTWMMWEKRAMSNEHASSWKLQFCSPLFTNVSIELSLMGLIPWFKIHQFFSAQLYFYLKGFHKNSWLIEIVLRLNKTWNKFETKTNQNCKLSTHL